MKRTIIVCLTLLSLTTTVHAGSRYRYAGVSRTAKAAYYTTATMTLTALPTAKVCSLGCHVLAWTILAQSTKLDNYVEAGVGFEPLKNSNNKQVALWWTNQKKQVAQIEGYVPIGTSVKVEITKVNGNNAALVEWTWPGGYKKKAVSLGTWRVDPGIHPTQLEVTTTSSASPPGPVAIRVENIRIYPEDVGTAYLYSDAPYIPVGTLTDFSVTYP